VVIALKKSLVKWVKPFQLHPFLYENLSQEAASGLIKLKPVMASVKSRLRTLATAPTQN
jgi:hypothetical protein